MQCVCVYSGETSLPSLPTRLGLSTRREQDIEDLNNRRDAFTQMDTSESKPSVANKIEDSPRDMSVGKMRTEVQTDVEMLEINADAENATLGWSHFRIVW